MTASSVYQETERGGYYAPGIGIDGPIVSATLPDGRNFKIHRAYKVKLASGRVVVIPAGFETDFASIPRLFWRLLPPWGPYSPATVIHDYLYRNGIGTRKEADLVLLDLMRRLGVSWWQRHAIYRGVRMGGWMAWKKKSPPERGELLEIPKK